MKRTYQPKKDKEAKFMASEREWQLHLVVMLSKEEETKAELNFLLNCKIA